MGLAGSLHCVGMCSPLAMAVSNMNAGAFLNRLIYNAGRILTYSTMGSLVASAGYFLPISRFQNLVSILLGIALLLIGVGLLKPNVPILSMLVGKFTAWLKTLFSKFLRQKNYASVFFMGTLNGFLPCGLVLIALSYCLTLSTAQDGFIFMLMFGAGTLPVMLGLTSVIPIVVKRFKFNMYYVTSGMLILSGVVLIARVFIIHASHAATFQEGVADIILCR